MAVFFIIIQFSYVKTNHTRMSVNMGSYFPNKHKFSTYQSRYTYINQLYYKIESINRLCIVFFISNFALSSRKYVIYKSWQTSSQITMVISSGTIRQGRAMKEQGDHYYYICICALCYANTYFYLYMSVYMCVYMHVCAFSYARYCI